MSNQIIKKPVSPLAKILKENAGSLPILKHDELIEAKLITITSKAAFFDLGKNGTGIIYGVELINSQDALKEAQLGDVMLVKVVDTENDEGYIELSLRETHKQKSWDKIKEIKELGEPFEINILGSNSGGLITEIQGLKAFLPVSQLSVEHSKNLDESDKMKLNEELKKFTGESWQVKILDFNPRNNKLILSEKVLKNDVIISKLTNYKVGDIVEGIITGVADFGAFMKFMSEPDIEGLIHISEIDHSLIENPKEIIKIDDVVKAKIIDIKDNRVSLSLKALKDNPWDEVSKKYKAGDFIKANITKFNPFGAFINIADGIQGLIHVSEFGSQEDMKSKLELNKAYDFIIDVVKPEEKRIVLKLKK